MDRQVVARVAEIARKHGVPRVHLAPAWLLQLPPTVAPIVAPIAAPIAAPIVGATKISHLEDAVGALPTELSAEEVASLEEPYVPHPVVGHQ